MLSNTDFSPMYRIDDVNDKVSYFYKVLYSSLDVIPRTIPFHAHFGHNSNEIRHRVALLVGL